MSKLSSFIVAVVVVAGCHKNPNYCPGANPDNNCSEIDAAKDSPTGCTSNAQCSGATGVCIISSMTCVQCTGADHAACMGVTPACGSDNVCHGCKAHSDCPSNACLPDGSCGDDTNVAYIDPAGTDNTTCTKATPCTKVAKALATTRPFVKFHGTTDEAVTISSQNVTLLADSGAKLTRTTNGNILVVDGTSIVSIYGLEVSGASGTGAGVSLPSGGSQKFTLVRARVANNAGGGVSILGGTFVIVGNVFFANGGATALVGGVSITATQNASNRLDFNSFNKNQTQDGIAPAIQCIAGTFTAKNNIMSGNGTLTQMDQVGGTCTHTYSIARPGTLPSGTGNIASDPLFLNTTTGDLHIQAGSPARHAADPAADLTGIAARDIDGDTRTAPADIGADQVP